MDTAPVSRAMDAAPALAQTSPHELRQIKELMSREEQLNAEEQEKVAKKDEWEEELREIFAEGGTVVEANVLDIWGVQVG